MSCCNTTSQVLVDPCSRCNEPSATNEPLPSALENFIAAFFGTLEKSVVGGKVVWTLPCRLEVGLENNPRQAGEGLACYFLRLFEAGIIGLTGPGGPKGDKGDEGKSGYSITTQAIPNATVGCPNIAIPVVDESPYEAGLYVFIPFAGYFLINEVLDNLLYVTLIQLSSGATSAISLGTPVVPAGPSGAQGAKGEKGDPGTTGATGPAGPQGASGEAGLSAQAELLTGFTQPAAGALVAGWVTLSRSVYAAPGQTVWIGGAVTAGYYTVEASVGAQLQLRNVGGAANAAPGTVFPVSAVGAEEWVVITGPRGLAGGEEWAIRAVAVTDDIELDDQVILADATAGAIILTLPVAADRPNVPQFIKKVDASANTVTVQGDGAETIDGANTAVLTVQYEAISIISDGTEWHIF